MVQDAGVDDPLEQNDKDEPAGNELSTSHSRNRKVSEALFSTLLFLCSLD